MKELKPDYGNWVPKRLIYGPVVIGIVLLMIAFVIPVLVIPAILFFMVTVYFAYARYQFSASGRNIQGKVHDLALENLDWDGKGNALDIGCGNGALVIGLAKKYPVASIMGVDLWGSGGEYSRDVCINNAKLEGVGERVAFRKASATALPFPDGFFDAVVSNLVFHEVKDAKDKRELIREALRVLKPGGKFAFQDLFLIKRAYGVPDDLIKTIQGWGIKKVEFIKTRNAPFIPLLLKLPFMIGALSLLKGEK
jgi:SAM-dependent methyltransferase